MRSLASLRELAPTVTRRIQFRARPRPGTLATNCSAPGACRVARPPAHAVEFDRMLRGALEEPGS
ncbi:hypothetical protein [Streptomyces sp. NPDC048442]|uniref:hypothetical protein n=1 Tax=Streptomyces sp. NPDC048442 TaxID=3154823 RepID=UPI00342C455B